MPPGRPPASSGRVDAPFGRVLTAMATAMHDDGSIDLDGTARIAEHLVAHGHDGVVVSGTTGESATTTVPEDGEILRAVMSAVGDRATVVAGVGTNATAHSVELARQAAEIGAHGVLLVCPYYNKPSQAGVLHHFEQVVAASDLPVMLYDVPGRTGLTIAPETYARAAESDRVVAVKDAVGDLARGSRLMADTGLAIYSGDDASNLGWLAHGASGVVSVAGHAIGDLLREMVDAFLADDPGTARAAYLRMLPVIGAVMEVPNYGATTAKSVLQHLGVLGNRAVRGPLVPLSDDEHAAVGAALRAAGLI